MLHFIRAKSRTKCCRKPTVCRPHCVQGRAPQARSLSVAGRYTASTCRPASGSGCAPARLLDSGDPDSDLISFSDITAEREGLDHLVYQANHDTLGHEAGNDEFVLLIYGDATRGKLDELVSRLRVRLAEPRCGPGDVQGQAGRPLDSQAASALVSAKRNSSTPLLDISVLEFRFANGLVGEQVHHTGEDARKMLGGRHDSRSDHRQGAGAQDACGQQSVAA